MSTFYELFNAQGGGEEETLALSGPIGRKNQAFNTVNNRMEFLEDVAKAALMQTSSFIEDLQALVRSLEAPDASDIEVEDAELPAIDYNSRPDLGSLDLDLTMPEPPAALALNPIDDQMEDVDFGVFNVPDPEFLQPEKPVLQELGVIPDAPVIEGVDIPTAPTISLPSAPSLHDIALPSAPDISIPDFDADIEAQEVLVPGGFTWGEPVYGSDIWAELLAKVLDGIMNGGTGLPSEVEDAIYWQHLNRTFAENDKAMMEAENYFAGRGFTLPTGMLAARLTEIANQAQRNNLQASKDIAISQAELAQKNTHFFIEKGAELEGMMRDFFVKNATLSLEGQKAVFGSAMEIFKAGLDRANYAMELHKTRASIWETRVRAALTQVEIFKAQIEGARVSAEVQKISVDIYTAQLAAADTLVRLYSGQMQAAAIHAEIQKAQMSLYGERIKAYMAQVELNKAKVLQYEAEWSGEKAKADVYSARVAAYSAEIGAKAKRLDALIAKLGARIENNKMLVEEYKARVGKYSAEIDGRTKAIGAKVDGFKALVAGYEAENSRDEAYYKAKIEEIRVRVQEASFRLQKAIAKVEASVRGYTAIKELQVKGTEGVLNTGAMLAASAVQGMNTSANISYNAGDSYSAQDSNSFSKQISESRSVQVVI